MRRALALAALIAVSASAAHAEHWTKYVDVPNGTAWSYDADYSYKDKQTGRLVVMQAISKPAASLGPSGPGKPDGVGSVVALDCTKKNMITLGSYTPSKPMDQKGSWRGDTPKKAEGPENDALMAAVCPNVDHLPVK
jgi:opacity protein-like surface antigen